MKLLSAVLFCVFAWTMSSPLRAGDAPYRHVVLFKFKDSATADQIKKVEEAFRALPSKINTIQSLEWGTNVSPENKNDGFTHCFFVTFKDKAGVDVYLPHPAHQEFGANLKGILDKVLVIDYVAKA
ncbi:MAG TPA: Dabb family protein [Verrucomicrobiaceae bacterium]